ncbi:TonB-dependent receptor [Roseivirga echinicomitans]|uniref:TonB-dependent receptor n=1 Tax=Roseivirga echinicomitans TaxID=296218 RepID=A0A150X1Y3_9BACT|nr:TonB-dependent receptor [Roseivirga echinicomitans]KYG72733.1 TonB-dependent receptor [Roseivirga echinicomitans]
MKHQILITLIGICLSSSSFAQTSSLSGTVHDQYDILAYATVIIAGTDIGTSTDARGRFKFEKIPQGKYNLMVSSVGYENYSQAIEIVEGKELTLDVSLTESKLNLNEVVVTGTRTAKRRVNTPVIVNLMDSKELDRVVATNLSEGLRFQPGLRVETDCQTCNYTQLRMNGLQGGYSQILINGRPIFSPLTGLYGMEQIPANMIERIEVVRGGVSALYGSSAIGGTVNVITKVPDRNEYTLTNTFQSIDGQAADNILSGNATLINEDEDAGATFFVNNRTRQAYDANGDNFSEAPELKNTSFGTNLFYLPSKDQKLSISLSSINEYRFGGEIVSKPAHLAQQSEERTHNIFMGSLDYQVNFNENKNSFIFYYGGQKTDRQHYTGIIPDNSPALEEFLANPPYGTSDVVTHQGGVQMNNRFDEFLGGNAVLTFGAEYVHDKVYDQIEAYNYLIDQTTRNIGTFVQHDWDVSPQLNLLTGFRLDKHNLMDKAIFSPRVSLLYKLKPTAQIRLGWGTGFRAPQAFDADLHIAFAGGGISRISLADNLKEERSNSLTASFNYDKATEHVIAGFTLEGFYTNLKDAFFLSPLGTDAFGERFEKRNGDGATVRGITLETRANFDYVFEVDAGFTIQSSLFTSPVENIEGLPEKREFLRTPNHYGYATLTYTPVKNWSLSGNLVYTGTMELVHFGGSATGNSEDKYYSSPTFTELGIRLGHMVDIPKIDTSLEFFGGIKNVFDAYQSDFDYGKNRDSNYVYGPSLPRTFFFGLKVKSN